MKKNILVLSFLMTNIAFTAESNSNTSSISKKDFFSARKWGASYFNYMNGPTMSEDSGEYSINHYLALKHKFSKSLSLTAVLRPDQKVGKVDKDAKKFTQGDSYLKLGLPEFYKSKKGSKIYSQLRYYAPLSESSKKKEIKGKVSPRIYATTSAGDFDLTYLLIPTIYLNKKSEDGQKEYSQGHWVQVSFNATEKLTVDLAAYPSWSYSKNEKSEFNDIPIYPGVSYAFTNKLSLSAYLEIIALKSESKTSSVGSSLSYTIF